MGTEESLLMSKILQLFSDFMTRVTMFEELVDVGSKLLVSFQQALEFVRRPPIEKTSELFQRMIKANETRRLLSYIEAGYVNTREKVESFNTSKVIIADLAFILENVRCEIVSASECSSDSCYEDNGAKVDSEAKTNSEALVLKEEILSSNRQEVTDYAAMLAIIYTMMKQDYVMEENIVSSLNFKTTSAQLESYCLMWSLRPYINDQIMRQAWRFIP